MSFSGSFWDHCSWLLHDFSHPISDWLFIRFLIDFGNHPHSDTDVFRKETIICVNSHFLKKMKINNLWLPFPKFFPFILLTFQALIFASISGCLFWVFWLNYDSWVDPHGSFVWFWSGPFAGSRFVECILSGIMLILDHFWFHFARFVSIVVFFGSVVPPSRSILCFFWYHYINSRRNVVDVAQLV